MRRKDTFFGLHFDYHANEWTPDIGKDFDPKVLEKIIEVVKPDFIQCDTKGHPGYSSYNTKVGYPAPGLKKDLLMEWRKVTKKHNVALFSHISGIWDMKMAKEHKDWSCINGNNEYTEMMSCYSPYVDEVMIPQLIELATTYDMDGAWVDGDCWCAMADYHPYVIDLYKKETGRDIKLDSPIEEQRLFWDFNREGHVKYVQKYIKAVKEVKPEFDITSNWFNTVYVPNNYKFTDYISGDLSPTNSVDSARFDGRVMQSFGRNWDIMSWGISYPIHYAKSAIQLCQEAASIIALGGGFQIYNMQCPQKVVMDEWAIPIWGEVAKFCLDRKKYCHESEIVPDIGVIYDVKSAYHNMNAIFTRDSYYAHEINGLVNTLCDLGKGISIVHSERLDELKLDEYSSLVLIDAVDIDEGVKNKCLDYAKRGGNLLLFGSDSAKTFAKDLNIKYEESNDNPIIMLISDKYKAEVRAPFVKILDEEVNNIYGHECIMTGDPKISNPPPTIEEKEDKLPLIIKKEYGDGYIYVVPVDLGESLFNLNSFEVNKFIEDVFSNIKENKYYNNHPSELDILVTKKEDNEYIHLINLLGNHRSTRIKTFDKIPPVYDVEVTYHLNKKPSKLVLVPEEKEIDFTYNNGLLKVKLDKVDLYTIIQIQF